MILYQSNTFQTETNLTVTAVYGSKNILEILHTEAKEPHQVSQFPISEWSIEKRKIHIIQTNTSFEALPSSLADDNIISAVGSVLNSENKNYKTSLSEFTILFDGNNHESDQHIILSQSHLAGLIIDCSIKKSQKEKDALYISIWDNSIFLTLIRNEQLINCNRFDCIDSAEAIYYTMLFVQEYQLNQETIDCKLYGDSDHIGTFGSEIKQYIRNVNIIRQGIVPQTDIDGVLSLIFGKV